MPSALARTEALRERWFATEERVSGPHIPLVDLRRQYEAHRKEIDRAIAGVVETGAFINGPDVRAFEEEFADYCGVRHCVGVSSGLEALRLILAALGIGPGDEVVLPANTFIATAFAVTGVGARPVLADCDPVTANLDPAAVARVVTPRTKAIMPVHLYGQPADWAALEAIAAPRGIALVEDAAQAHGARHRGRRCGSLGRAAGFSFYPGKNLGAFGDAGAVTTGDDALAEYVRAARDYGQRRKYEHAVKGGNWRLDTLQAAVLRIKLRHLDAWNAARRAAAAAYSARLAGLPLRLPEVAAGVEPVWHLYVVECERRDELVRRLNDRGIGAGVHYPVPVHLQDAYADLGYARGAFPNAERQARRVLSLPMFPEITDAEITTVCDALAAGLAAPRAS
jgi:dTDP-4-amino-4,6-dideoxygalactose transaminase